MDLKAIFSILSGKGYEDFSGNINAVELNMTFIKGKRPDKINIQLTEKNLFNVKLNIKRTVYNIDKTEHVNIDENSLMIILREL